ncbi:neuropeptide Y receptor type 6-like [Mercenaria mercenaria]|uniref:neuropeptide Y receptor type 6-like n=1 Tax=Mercenaria mercenaria TaxID=6596 RepID=UPI001E1DCD4A|nr:neuropeptide Y receptor type 6-like [Mercenaria mercenaria]XP_045156651.1 neuropeptide Y receptor type 6-like [Mercenaria mercenaria]
MEGTKDLPDIDPGAEQGEAGPNVHMLLKIVILGVIGFVSIIGNGIALGTLIIYNKQLRVTIYIVIGGLALADIVVAVMNVPNQIMYQAEKGELKSETWCKFYGVLYNSCQYIAAFHLVVLGVLRGILLTDRAHHGPTAIHALITCAILWVASLLANIPMISSSIHDPYTKRCVVKFSNKDKDTVSLQNEDSSAEERYLILSAAFSYFMPLVLIFIIYMFTGYMSKRFFEDSYSRRERRMSKMISSLIVTFALCRLPSETITLLWFYQMKNTDMVQVLYNDTDKYKVWINVREYLQILSMFDMAIRPIIYATMSREFGLVYDKVINCTYCKDDEEEELPPRLRRRGNEIEEVLHTPLRQNPELEVQDCPDNEPEEIF